MREWKVTDGYKVKADELSWEELKNATENVIELSCSTDTV